MNLQDLIGKRECILNPRLVFRIQLCSRIQMCTLWSQFSNIFTYKRILRGHTPKCQHLFYLTAFILFSDTVTTATCQALRSSPGVPWWTRRTWACRSWSMSTGGSILGRQNCSVIFLFFNLISEVATFNTFVIRKCYYLKISTVFKTHIVLLYLCGDGLKNIQNLNDATMFNKSKAPDKIYFHKWWVLWVLLLAYWCIRPCGQVIR